MEYNISIDENKSRFIVRTQGPIDFDTEEMMLSEMVTHPMWNGRFNVLFDYSESTLEHFTMTDIQNLSQLIQNYSNKFGTIKLATVLRTDINFGLGRMWEAYTSYYMPCKINIFRTIEEAEYWLDADHI